MWLLCRVYVVVVLRRGVVEPRSELAVLESGCGYASQWAWLQRLGGDA